MAQKDVRTTVELGYGAAAVFSCALPAERILFEQHLAPAVADRDEAVRAALAAPINFPPFDQAVVPGDRVVVALDRDVPGAAVVLREVCRILERRGVVAGDVEIVQPPPIGAHVLPDPRSALPEAWRSAVRWQIHDPADAKRRAYLASTAGGERIYLARSVVEADFVLTVGPVAYDSVLGYRGTHSVFYPGLSSAEAIRGALGLGHRELEPDDERPLRQTIDEIGWLLGSLCTVQVVPGGRGEVGAVLAGASEPVFAAGKRLLAEHALVQTEHRADTVVVSVPTDAGGHGWRQVGAALEAARNVVARDGCIVALTELTETPGPGLEILKAAERPRDALRPLRAALPDDLVSATQIAAAADWAAVHLLSRLDPDLVEELAMVPLATPDEARRLVITGDTCGFLDAAQFLATRVRSG